MGPDQFDVFVLLGSLGNTLSVGLDVSQITNMSLLIFWRSVILIEWVEVGSCRRASVGVVTKFMNVHSTHSIWIVARDFIGNTCRRVFVLLGEGDNSTHSGVSTDDGNCYFRYKLAKGHIIRQGLDGYFEMGL